MSKKKTSSRKPTEKKSDENETSGKTQSEEQAAIEVIEQALWGSFKEREWMGTDKDGKLTYKIANGLKRSSFPEGLEGTLDFGDYTMCKWLRYKMRARAAGDPVDKLNKEIAKLEEKAKKAREKLEKLKKGK